MPTRNRMFDDAARVAGGAFGTLAGIKREIDALARAQFERLIGGLDLVTRDEFEAVREMAAKARAEQDALEARVAAFEKLAGIEAPKRPARRARRRKPD
jgi:BMFP domain-containing protein YqiC